MLVPTNLTPGPLSASGEGVPERSKGVGEAPAEGSSRYIKAEVAMTDSRPTHESDEERQWRTSTDLWAALKTEARRMRAQPTEAERALWEALRGRRLCGLRFRRQHTLDRFIVDFCCADASLVVEVDGPIHVFQRGGDEERDALIASLGLHVLRFTSEQVLGDLQAVLQDIVAAARVR